MTRQPRALPSKHKPGFEPAELVQTTETPANPFYVKVQPYVVLSTLVISLVNLVGVVFIITAGGFL